MHKLTALIAGLGLVASTAAYAKKVEEQPGIPLIVQVVEKVPEGEKREAAPIPTAKVRNPDEKDPHPVNRSTGEWLGRVMYLQNGNEVIFDQGMALTFEVSAPGYLTQKITYVMRKRKNKVIIALEKMSLSFDDEEEEDPVIQFGRDKPRGGREAD
jgi:hypothetical protein